MVWETYSKWASCTVVEGKASAALGRALMGTLLLGALKGDAETVQVLYIYSLLSSLDISAYIWWDLHLTVPTFQRSRHCKNCNMSRHMKHVENYLLHCNYWDLSYYSLFWSSRSSGAPSFCSDVMSKSKFLWVLMQEFELCSDAALCTVKIYDS